MRSEFIFLTAFLFVGICGQLPIPGDRLDQLTTVSGQKEVDPSGNSSAESSDTQCFKLRSNDPQYLSITHHLDKCRHEIVRQWFPSITGHDWTPPCDVYLYFEIDENANEGRQAPGSLGHAIVVKDRSRVLRRKIVLDVSDSSLLNALIPHEVAHVVIASYLDVPELPCWLDEGIAMTCEPDYKQAVYGAKVRSWLASESLRSEELTCLDSAPRGKLSDQYYTRAYALTIFLIETHDRATVLRLAEACHRDGQRAAFKNLLNVIDFAELDKAVKAHFAP